MGLNGLTWAQRLRIYMLNNFSLRYIALYCNYRIQQVLWRIQKIQWAGDIFQKRAQKSSKCFYVEVVQTERS